MPRRESYRTDDEDDDTRRAAASGGGGVPGWVWLLGGGGALAALLVLALGFFAFSRREAAVQHEVARADMMRAEVQARPRMVEADLAPGGLAGPEGPLPVLSLTRITNLYKNDRVTAEGRYTNQRVRVRVEVKAAGVGAGGEPWAGAAADLGAGVPRGAEPNVVFRLVGEPVAVGTTVEIEGRCDGLLPDPRGGETLTFTDCRVARE